MAGTRLPLLHRPPSGGARATPEPERHRLPRGRGPRAGPSSTPTRRRSTPRCRSPSVTGCSWERRLDRHLRQPAASGPRAALTSERAADRRRRAAGQPQHRRDRPRPWAARHLVLRTSRRGDFSIYRLALVTSAQDPTPPAGFDPLLSAVDFSFKVDCPTDFDCAAAARLPARNPPGDRDRLPRARLRELPAADARPDRRARARTGASGTRADLGVALVELLAYVGDYLELPPGRRSRPRPTSARRAGGSRSDATHASSTTRCTTGATPAPGSRCCSTTSAPAAGVAPAARRSRRPDVRPGSSPASTRSRARWTARRRTRSLATAATRGLRAARRRHALPDATTGSTSTPGAPRTAACRRVRRGPRSPARSRRLAAGDVLMLEEVVGPGTGDPADADPAHRHAVRLTAVTHADRSARRQFRRSADRDRRRRHRDRVEQRRRAAVPAVRLGDDPGRGEADPVPIERRARQHRARRPWADDRGRALPEAGPGADARPLSPATAADARREPSDPIAPTRSRRTLAQAGRLAHAAPYDAGPAGRGRARCAGTLADVVPEVAPRQRRRDRCAWEARRDLLGLERDRARLRRRGRGRRRGGPPVRRRPSRRAGPRPGRPSPRPTGSATGPRQRRRRTRSPTSSRTPTAIVAASGTRCRRAGGIEPETVEDVRRFAPVAFRTQERAVTADDYARDGRAPSAGPAAPRRRSAGRAAGGRSFVTADPLAARRPTTAVRTRRWSASLEPLPDGGPRSRGRHAALRPARDRHAGLRHGATTSVPTSSAALLERVQQHGPARRTTRALPPDNFTFGQPVYLSRLYAAAYAVDGRRVGRRSRGSSARARPTRSPSRPASSSSAGSRSPASTTTRASRSVACSRLTMEGGK